MDGITDQKMMLRCRPKIPTSLLRDHLYYGITLGRKKRAKLVLQEDGEKKLIVYLLKKQDLRHPLTLAQLGLKVTQTIQSRKTSWSIL